MTKLCEHCNATEQPATHIIVHECCPELRKFRKEHFVAKEDVKRAIGNLVEKTASGSIKWKKQENTAEKIWGLLKELKL